MPAGKVFLIHLIPFFPSSPSGIAEVTQWCWDSPWREAQPCFGGAQTQHRHVWGGFPSPLSWLGVSAPQIQHPHAG